MKKRLGEILLERGLIDVDQLNSSLAHQRQWGMRLGAALVVKGFIAEGMLTRVLAETLNIPMVDLSRVVVDNKALALVPRRIAEQHQVLPISLREQPNGRRMLVLAMADPLNATAVDEIAFTTDTIVKPAIAQISSLEQAIRRHYYGERVDIPPLAMERRGPASMTSSVTSDTMTIMTGHGQERVVSVLPSEPIVDAIVAPPARPPAEYGDQATGVFSMPPIFLPEGAAAAPTPRPGAPRPADLEDLEALEKKFWALMRVLARRGLVTKEEFLAELRAAD